MAGILEVLDTKELVLVVIALGGLVPVAMHYREESKWFAVGYLLLVVGAVATNVEALFLEELFNAVEHGVGILASGIAFLVAAYLRRQQVLNDDENNEQDGVGSLAGLLER